MDRVAWALAVLVLLAAPLALAAMGPAFAAPPPSDVPPGHWAYADVDELCARGLIEGYPAGKFEGARPVTRYEMASLVVRAVRAIAQAMREQGERLQQAVAQEAPAPALPQAVPIAGPKVVRPEDIARVEKLIAEFRTELVTMGVRVDDLARQVADLRAGLKAVDQRVSGLETEVRKHHLSGTLQLRYTQDRAKDPSSEFAIRRARLGLSGPASPRTDYTLLLQLESKLSGGGPGSKLQLRDAYLTRHMGRAALRVGQTKLPFGYELEMSDAALLAGERALVMDQLFPDQRDIGVVGDWERAGRRLDLAVVNGSGINAADENNHKDVVARVGVPVSGGSVAASFYDGRAGRGDTTVKSRAGLGADLTFKRTNLRAEYLRGRNLGKPVSGWYGEVSQRLRKTPGTFFVKYDVFDEDRVAPGDRFRRATFGYAHDLDAATRLSLVFEHRRPERRFSLFDTFHGDVGFAQLQVVY